MNFFADVFICLIYIILVFLILHILFGVIQLLLYLYNYMIKCNRKRNTKIIPIEIYAKDKYLLVYDPDGNIYLGTVSKT